MKTNAKKSSNVGKVLVYVFLVIGAFVMFIPFFWTLSTSLKTKETVYLIPPQIFPNPVTFDNYKFVWANMDFFRYTLNSIFVVVLDVAGQVLSGCVIAYGFSLFKFKGRNFLFMIMLGTMMMPSQVTMIPTYFIWSKLNLLNTYAPLIVTSYFGKAFGIYLMTQNFKSLPYSFYEAARIDGANPFSILIKIYMPISVPSIVTMTVFAFIGAWNNTLGPLLYLNKSDMWTLPLGLLKLNDIPQASSNVAIKMAGAAIVMAPTILVYFLAQKQFVEGVASSGVKG